MRHKAYNHVLLEVRDNLQPKNFGTEDRPRKESGDQVVYGRYDLLREDTIVDLRNLDDYPHLRCPQSLQDSLCQGFFPDLPNLMQAECNALYPDSKDDYNMQDESDTNMKCLEYEPTADVVL